MSKTTTGDSASKEIVPHQIQPPPFDQRHASDSHDLLDFDAIVGLVAMNRTFLAHRFGIQGTFVQTGQGIVQHIGTLFAQAVRGSVLLFAIDPNKSLEDFLILGVAGQSRMLRIFSVSAQFTTRNFPFWSRSGFHPGGTG